MRLLYIQGDAWSDEPLDIRLTDFYGEPPPYMILSHRWREEELSFSDMISENLETVREKKAYAKIENACRIALQMGLPYAWVDTCCIDKSSSAELSEAINSMYQWYAKSNICFAYLDDIDDFPSGDTFLQDSCWFTRGWTLQELIAPKELYFYSKGWKGLGTKSTICSQLAAVSGIPKRALIDPNSLRSFSIAERMSWAAFRETTRSEDEAYSLMGLFSVNMPPLYGEGGRNAFRRLQIEIMQTSHDHTIFAWNKRTTSGDMLASSVRDFLGTYTYRRMNVDEYLSVYNYRGDPKLDYSMTNIGLNIQLPIAPVKHMDGYFFAFLACQTTQDRYVAVFLKRRPGFYGGYYRVAIDDSTLSHPSREELGYHMPIPKTIWVSERDDFGIASVAGSGAILNQERFYVDILFDPGWRVLQDPTELHFRMNGESLTAEIERHRIETKVVCLVMGRTAVDLVIGQVNGWVWLYAGKAHSNLVVYDDDLQNHVSKLQDTFQFPRGSAWRTKRDSIHILYRDPSDLPYGSTPQVLPAETIPGFKSGQTPRWCFNFQKDKTRYAGLGFLEIQITIKSKVELKPVPA